MGIQSLPTSVGDILIGHRGPVVVTCFFGWPNRASLQAAAEAQRSVVARYGKVLTLTLIPPAELQRSRNSPVVVTLPDEDRDATLKATASVSEGLAESTTASAMVILQKGVVSIMVRSFMATISLVSRSRVPLKTFTSLPDAVSWLESVPGSPGALKHLETDIEVWLKEAGATPPRS